MNSISVIYYKNEDTDMSPTIKSSIVKEDRVTLGTPPSIQSLIRRKV